MNWVDEDFHAVSVCLEEGITGLGEQILSS